MKTTFLLSLISTLFFLSEARINTNEVKERRRNLKKGSGKFPTSSSKSGKSSTSTSTSEDDQVSIVNTVAGDADLSLLFNIVAQQPAVLGALSGNGPFTLFAPTNRAFTDLFTILEDLGVTLNSTEIDDVLFYHALSGEYQAKDLSDGLVRQVNGESIIIEKFGKEIVINLSTNVVEADIEATNGVIHKIDEVLLPPTQTIAEIAVNNGFNTLVSLLTSTNLVGLVADAAAGPFTVFAPTDAAFAKLGDISGLSTAQVTEILLYHVVPGLFGFGDLQTLNTIPTKATGDLLIQIQEQGVLLNGLVNVVDVDNLASNGVVHVIDTVLGAGLLF